MRRYSDGKVLSRTEDFNLEMRRKYDAPFWDLHRVDVQIALKDRAKGLGVQVRLGAKVVNIDYDKPSLVSDSGEELEADLIVGADGLWSKCREQFLPTKGKSDSPLPTGDLAYRIVLNLEDLGGQELRDWVSKPSCQFWIGPGSHIVAYSLRGGTMFNFVLLVPDDLPANVARQPGSLDEIRQLFADWDPVLNRFLDQVKTVDKWKLMHRPGLESWVSERSNFVFIGDSCHPMSPCEYTAWSNPMQLILTIPDLAQGANSSIEDGAALGYILASLESKEQLPSALTLYERIRKKRGEAIVRETFAQRADFHIPDGPEQEARDDLMLSQLDKAIDCKFPSRW